MSAPPLVNPSIYFGPPPPYSYPSSTASSVVGINNGNTGYISPPESRHTSDDALPSIQETLRNEPHNITINSLLSNPATVTQTPPRSPSNTSIRPSSSFSHPSPPASYRSLESIYQSRPRYSSQLPKDIPYDGDNDSGFHYSSDQVTAQDPRLSIVSPDNTLVPNNEGVQKNPATFQCDFCPKRYTRAYNLRRHFRTHMEERPFVCKVCAKTSASEQYCKRHEGLHGTEKKFECRGELDHEPGKYWGCGRQFQTVDALGRHLQSNVRQVCLRPILDRRKEQWGVLPAELLQRYPELHRFDWLPVPVEEEPLLGSTRSADSGYESAIPFDPADAIEVSKGRLFGNERNTGSMSIEHTALPPSSQQSESQRHPSMMKQDFPQWSQPPDVFPANFYSFSNFSSPLSPGESSTNSEPENGYNSNTSETSVFSSSRKDLISRLMDEICTLFFSQASCSPRRHGEGAGSSTDSSTGSLQTSVGRSDRNNYVPSETPRKRTRSDDEDPDEEDDRKRKRRRTQNSIPDDNILTKMLCFACPFHKFDQLTYSNGNDDSRLALKYRSCGPPGWPTIGKMK